MRYGTAWRTAATQRPQISGCSAHAPTSVSQCQQRSHFCPSAFTASTVNSVALRLSAQDQLGHI